MTDKKLLSCDLEALKNEIDKSSFITSRIMENFIQQAKMASIWQEIKQVFLNFSVIMLLVIILIFLSDHLFIILSLFIPDSSIILNFSSGISSDGLAFLSLELPLKDLFRLILKSSLALLPYLLPVWAVIALAGVDKDFSNNTSALELLHEK